MTQFDLTTAKFKSAMSGFAEAYGNLSDGMESALKTSEDFIKAFEAMLAGRANLAQSKEGVANDGGQLDMNVGTARTRDSLESFAPYEAKKNDYVSKQSSEVAINFWMKSLLLRSTHGGAERPCRHLIS
jgi:hypothetical protein